MRTARRVCRVRWDPRALQARTVTQETWVLSAHRARQEPPATQDPSASREVSVCLARPACLGPPAYLDQLDQSDHTGSRDRKAPLET